MIRRIFQYGRAATGKPAAALLFCALLPAATGCVSARMSQRDADRAFRAGRYEDAAQSLERGLASEGADGRDLLLYLLDLGLTLHSAGKYEESNKYFLRADQIAEIKDYTSLSTESATLLTSDNIRDYKGEDFEKVLINTYLAMNFALMGDVEGGLVEARRVNRKLHMMITDGQRKYKQNAFARYLSGILYEMEGNFNEAHVDYKMVRELEPGFPGLGRDLYRTARLSRQRDEADRWVREFSLSREDQEQALLTAPRSDRRAEKAEIIVLYENGISPEKRPNPDFTQVPRFYPRYNPVRMARVQVNGEDRGATAVLHDIEATAVQNLNEKYAGIVARKLAGIVAKETLAHQIEKQTKSPLLGMIAKGIMYVSDQADVRSWNLLPRDLQIARIPVEPGTYTVSLTPLGAAPLPARTVQVQAGKKAFVNFRYMP